MPTVLEINACRHCGLLIELVVGVGWVHLLAKSPRPEWEPCAQPRPRWSRCSVCGATVPSTASGVIDLHGSGSCTRLDFCPGAGVPGRPPRDESAAFE